MKRRESPIKSRVLFVALAPVVATAIALALYFTLLRYDDVETSLRQRGEALTRQLAAAAQYGLFSGNVAELNRLVGVLQHEPDVATVAIYDRQGSSVAATRPMPAAMPLPLGKDWTSRSKNGELLSFHRNVVASTISLDDLYAEKPTQDLTLGSVTVELSRKNLVARKKEILAFTALATLFILLVAGFIARRLGRDISEPVLALEKLVKDIREGRLGSRVAYHPAGTLSTLEEGINDMAATIERNQRRNTEALSTSRTQLQQQHEFAGALLEAQSKAGICMITLQNDRAVFANSAALAFFGTDFETLQQIEIPSLVAPESREVFNHEYQRVLNGHAAASRIEVKVFSSSGAERWAEIAAFAIMRDTVRHIAVLGVDMTQRKLDAQRLVEAHRTLRRQRDEAERASVAKSRFLAAASHDLRQPLHALSLFTDQLREEVETDTQIRITEQITAAASDMSDLLDSLLDISRLDLATLQPDIRPVELRSLFAQVVATHSQAAAAKRLQLRVVPTALWVESDQRYLLRIVSNFVANAIRYTEHGGVVIGVRRKGDKVRIEVWDSGVGIEGKYLPFVFQEFYQINNPERDANKGLGLGLAIVDRLANALRQHVFVRSAPGAGSVFGIAVPRAQAVEPDTETGSAAEVPAIRILPLIDDQDQLVEVTAMLEQWGYATASCLPADVAGDETATPPAIVVCDRRNLERAVLLARTSPEDASSGSVICISEPDNRQECSEIQTCAWLPLPIKPARLRALIMHLTS